MIPLFIANQILNIFANVINYLHWKRSRFEYNGDDEFEVISMNTRSMLLVLEYFKVTIVLHRILRDRQKNKRKKLVKPHKLIWLIRAYSLAIMTILH